MKTLDIRIVSEPSATLSPEHITEAYGAAKAFSAIAELSQEVFGVIDLDGAHHIIGTPRIVTVGLLTCNQVHPREVFAPAIAARAESIIVAHNHPSGTLEASPEDIAMTERLVKAGRILGIEVLDHVIVSRSGYLSLRQQGVMV